VPHLAADARLAHEQALSALRDGGRYVTSDAAAALRPISGEVAVACAWGQPAPAMLAPDADPLPTSYRVMLERWFGSPTDFGTRMVEVSYNQLTNQWVLTSNLWFPAPEPYHSKNGSAQGCHRGSPQALAQAYTDQSNHPVAPGHLRDQQLAS
jgi:hypothetical protein